MTTTIEIALPPRLLRMLKARARREGIDVASLVLELVANEFGRLNNAEIGRAKAAAVGIKFGRKRILTSKQIALVKRMRRQGRTTRDVGAEFGVSKATISRIGM